MEPLGMIRHLRTLTVWTNEHQLIFKELSRFLQQKLTSTTHYLSHCISNSRDTALFRETNLFWFLFIHGKEDFRDIQER